VLRIKKKKYGFTLIELLVVIAIIGILATIIMVSLNNARIKARDARRMSDMNSINKAMSLYYELNDASYYTPGNPPVNWPNDFLTPCSPSIVEIAKGSYMIMAKFPEDPSTKTYYCSDANDSLGRTYCVWVEKEMDPTKYIIANRNGAKETSNPPTTTASCNQ
jgi:prepilin-type N-terminal cleavage/methylation domain-containing protein